MISTSPTLHLADEAVQISPRRLSRDTPVVSAPCPINILGAVGSGAPLLGLAVAEIRPNAVPDTDIFSGRPTHPPFRIRRHRDSRRARLPDGLARMPHVIVSGSVVGWRAPWGTDVGRDAGSGPLRQFPREVPGPLSASAMTNGSRSARVRCSVPIPGPARRCDALRPAPLFAPSGIARFPFRTTPRLALPLHP